MAPPSSIDSPAPDPAPDPAQVSEPTAAEPAPLGDGSTTSGLGAFAEAPRRAQQTSEPFVKGVTPSQAETAKPPSDMPPAPPLHARPEAGADALLGTTISERYLLLSLLGEGGMGAVYLAEHTHMHKRMAVKVLHPEMSRMPEVVARFEREAMAAAHIEHPNVASASDFGKLPDGSFFLALEYVEGKNLREVLAKERLALGRTMRVLRQIVLALVRAHSLGIVHRDLKPENVMLVERDGEPDFVKVLDFGIAKVPVGELALGSSSKDPHAPVLTKAGMVYGTPEYMAPEQALGQAIDARADLYSLGVMAYEMLCGARPFDDESKVRLLGKHVTGIVPPMAEMGGADVPPELAAVVLRLLAKEAEDRTPDAKTLLEELDGLFVLLVGSGRLEGKLPTMVGGAPLALALTGPVGAAMSAQTAAHAEGAGLGIRAAPAPTGALGRLVGERKILLGGVAAGALLLAGITLALALRGSHAPAGGVVPMLADAAPLPSAELATLELDQDASTAKETPITDPSIREGLAAMESGDKKRGLALLEPYADKPQSPPQVHRALMNAWKETAPRRAIAQATRLVERAPLERSAVDVLVVARDLALGEGEAEDDAFALLTSSLGSNGADVLYEIAYGEYATQYPKAQRRAVKVLAEPAVRAKADPALGVALDLRRATGCDAKPLLETAASVGDRRSLPLLQGLAARKKGRRDPIACLRAGGALDRAIAEVQARVKASK